MREIAGYGRELSEEEKKTLFFRHYFLKVLGCFEGDKKLVTEYRLLPELSAVCRAPTKTEYNLITNAGIADTKKALKVGTFVIGEEKTDKPVLFEPWKFEKRRTAIFARTGYGKSNLCKVVVSLASLAGETGLLVLDLDGEYAFKTKTRAGEEVLGLADVEGVKGNLVVYTQRKEGLDKYEDVYISPFLNLELLGPFEIGELCKDQDLKVIPEFKYGVEREKWRGFVREYRCETEKKKKTSKLEMFCASLKSKDITDGQIRALRRNLRPILEWDEPDAPNIVEDIKYHLARKRLIVLDLSLLTLDIGFRVAQLILDRIFDYNVAGATTGRVIDAIAVFEEAQNVLNKKAVDDGSSIFTRWAKEGRKFQLGLIYVTQQPGAIAEEIVSQTDNFFVMHLLNKGDIDALRKANPHYDGVVADFLRRETIVGNTYVYSAPQQPYIFPAYISRFDNEFFKRLKHGRTARPPVLGDLNGIADYLKPKVKKEYEKWSTFIGRCSYLIYEYFDRLGSEPLFTDEGENRLDFSMATHLVNILIQRGLLIRPTIKDKLIEGEVEHPEDVGERTD